MGTVLLKSVHICWVTTGKLHFVKFETSKMDACLDFIEAKGLHRYRHDGQQDGIMTVMATGGGAYKFAEVCAVVVTHQPCRANA